ncbi:ABC transporter ATP-binding protein [Phytoactinopolyspora halophila]|uniref:ABC transporter ATP-binding protein n=1 Tax=Phytoactinopolyspora halophila TaxID=1981511 RepID=UPI001314DD10|nr:ABC transporter ATP-binding protein [Phytoactinopolyspora halophila]
MTHIVEIADVTKRYGDANAVNQLTVTVDQPGIHGLLGRNGAGKTTLMKLVAGHLKPTSGEVRINGEACSPQRMSRSVSFVESRASQFNMGASSLLRAAHQLHNDFDDEFARTMLSKFELDPKKKYKRLSFGMQTMVSTIIGLAINTDVVMLDEPSLGFDVVMRRRFIDLLRESLDRHPRIILVSTHQMDDIARVADHLLVIDAGTLRARAPMSDIASQFASADDYFLSVLEGSTDE